MATPPRNVEYRRRQPEHTALHRIVTACWGYAQALCRQTADGAPLPEFIQRAVKRYLGCGDLRRGMIRVHCNGCHKDLFVAFSCKVRGMCPSCDGKRMTEMAAHLVDEVMPAVPVRQWVLSLPFDLRYLLAWNMPLRSAVLGAFMRAVDRHYQQQAKDRGIAKPQTGAISVIQRFNSALQLDVHFHVLYADGVWSEQEGKVLFHPAAQLDTLTVQEVVLDAVYRIARQVKRFGYTSEDAPDALGEKDPAFANLLRAAIQGRQLTGAEAGKPPSTTRLGVAVPRPVSRNCAEFAGFSLHANTRIHEVAREHLERMCKYLLRPAVSASRLELLDNGKVRLELKTTWKNGVTHVIMPQADLVLRMAAQIPLPKRPVLRYHGIFAPAARLRSKVVPAGEKPKCRRKNLAEDAKRETSTRLPWHLALQRAFRLDILACKCGSRRIILAAVLERAECERIVAHLAIAQPEEIEAIRGPPAAFAFADAAPDPWDVADDDPDAELAA